MKILFLQKRPLFPTDTGGKIRTLNIVRHLARWHEVTYLCNMQASESRAIQQMESLSVRMVTQPWRETPRGSVRFFGQLASNLVSPYPFNVNKDFDPRLRARAAELIQSEDFDLILCDFVQMARNALGLDGPPSILFQHNVEAEIFQRHAATDRGWLRRKYMGHQYRKMQKFERQAGHEFDAVIAVSQRDRQMFEQQYGWQHVQVIDTAVDVDYFRSSDEREVADRIVFVGSMDWLPNEDGIIDFVEHTWPKIHQRRPQATFQIVGRNPGEAIGRLSGAPGVEVVGTVPDVRPYLSAASLVVVPLRIGGGTRIKIYEAMAMRKAVVSTSLGAEGLDVRHGQEIELANDPDAFAESVLDLLEDAKRRDQMSRCAERHVIQNYSSEVVARQFSDICESVIAKAKRSDSVGDRSLARELQTAVSP